MSAINTRLVLFTIAVLAVALVVLWRSRGESDASPERVTEDRSQDDAASPPLESGEALRPRSDAARSPEEPRRAVSDTRYSTEATRYAGRVALRAVRHDDGSPVTEFSWRFVGTTDERSTWHPAEGGVAWLPVPLGEAVAVELDAPGFVTSMPVDVSLRHGATTGEAVARLVARIEGPAVILRVTDDVGRPVGTLRIRCETQMVDSPRRDPWIEAWQRSSVAEDGVHEVRDLDPGRYRFRVVAVDAEGRPALLAPVSQGVRFNGSERVEVDVRLAPAGSIVLRSNDELLLLRLVTDQTATLTDRSGVQRKPTWQIAEGNPVAPTAIELAEPLLPGPWVLEMPDDGVRREITVWLGQRTEVKVP